MGQFFPMPKTLSDNEIPNTKHSINSSFNELQKPVIYFKYTAKEIFLVFFSNLCRIKIPRIVSTVFVSFSAPKKDTQKKSVKNL